jgi:hypothetical protein
MKYNFARFNELLVGTIRTKMAQRPKSRNSLPSDKHPVTLFSPALHANFQGDLLTAFGSPGKIISDLKSPTKAPAIFHRRRDGSKFSSNVSVSRRSPPPQISSMHPAPLPPIDPCEVALLQKIGGYGSVKHGRLIAHAARFDMFEDQDAKDTDYFPNKSQDVKRGLTSAQIAVLKEMSLRSQPNSLIYSLDDKNSTVHSDAIEVWLQETISERNKFSSAHLFTKAKLRESMEKPASDTPTANETAILCCCLADMIVSLSLTTDIKAELAQVWGRLMRSVFQNWDDSATAVLVSQMHEPFLKNEPYKKIIETCYTRHPYHDIADKVR